jgi:hypothetical protein
LSPKTLTRHIREFVMSNLREKGYQCSSHPATPPLIEVACDDATLAVDISVAAGLSIYIPHPLMQLGAALELCASLSDNHTITLHFAGKRFIIVGDQIIEIIYSPFQHFSSLVELPEGVYRFSIVRNNGELKGSLSKTQLSDPSFGRN